MIATVRPEDVVRRNLLLLVQLRWLAIGGQLITIWAVQFGYGIALPHFQMLAVLGGLIALNLVQMTAERRRPGTNAQLLVAVLIDIVALAAQIYLSGGATNPFATLFLLQVVLGAVLLPVWSSWLVVAVTSGAFGLLTTWFRPLALPPEFASSLSAPFLAASWVNFTLSAVLLVLFLTRVARNLQERDAHLAAMRQRAAEEEHIVRMGLLASGAAHELGTPLASLSVALGDWWREPAIQRTPHLAQEVDEMREEVARCKQILSGILMAAGEVTGQAPERTTLRRFCERIVCDWSAGNPDRVRFHNQLGRDRPIVADHALAQAITNLFDNAVEAGATAIEFTARKQRGELSLVVQDDGPGFPLAVLANLGKPYQSTKDRRGAGLGLFLASNVLRTLGGTLSARDLPRGGAEVTLTLPLDALALEEAS